MFAIGFLYEKFLEELSIYRPGTPMTVLLVIFGIDVIHKPGRLWRLLSVNGSYSSAK
jgi:hypothetical protein